MSVISTAISSPFQAATSALQGARWYLRLSARFCLLIYGCRLLGGWRFSSQTRDHFAQHLRTQCKVAPIGIFREIVTDAAL